MKDNFNENIKESISDLLFTPKSNCLNLRENSLIDCSECEHFMIDSACIDCPYKK